MTNNYNNIQLSERRNVIHLSLNRPKVHNAINKEMLLELKKAFQTINSSGIPIVILKGNGASFCAGADIEWLITVLF